MSAEPLHLQADIINHAHALTPIVQQYSSAWGGSMIQRWRGFFGAYDIPPLTFPIIAIVSGGRAKFKRVGSHSRLSIDHAMPGDIALIPPQTTMSWRVNGEMDVITLTFSHSELNQRIESVYRLMTDKLEDAHYVASFNNSYLFTNANHLCNVAMSSDKSDFLQPYMDTHLHSLGMYVQHYLGHQDNGLTEFQLHSHAVNYTAQRLTLGISSKIHIEDIAEELRVTPAFLTKKFKQEVGITPHKFLLHKRIQRAQSLLSGSDVDIATIAVDCGFSHQSHLTRHFTQLTGVSPAKFRQQSKNSPTL